jgi:hypothetical protein
MGEPARSFEKFNYTLRPSKQVERKLFIEALHYLGHHAGFPIKEYTYLGMGSVYYADFILFHKYLYIDKMICIEGAHIEKRMKFNKPYKFIDLRMGKIAEVFPSISFRKKKYLAWLDYDYTLDPEVLLDVDSFARKLEPGSILIVTVDAEPKLRDDEEFEKLAIAGREKLLYNHYAQCSRGILSRKVEKGDLARNSLPELVAMLLRSRIEKSILYRSEPLEFFQLFNYVYADGAQMVTIGGIIDAPGNGQNLIKSGIFKKGFAEVGTKPKRLTVPPLTNREKTSIDKLIKCGVTEQQVKKKLPFELDDYLIENYVAYYRHYPMYYEAVL